LANSGAGPDGSRPEIWPDCPRDWEEHKVNDDAGGGRRLRRMWCPRAGLLAIVAGAALLTAACSGGSSTPQVASLGNSSSDGGGSSAGSGNGNGSSAATGSGNATQLVDEWATCMRSHGDPNQVDPSIDSDGDIEITMTNVSPELSSEAHDSAGPCGHYLTAAASALRDGRPAPKAPSLAKQLEYAECMRADGVPKFPDPNGSGSTYVGNLDPTGPVFVHADQVCSKKAGEISSSDPAPAGVVQVQSTSGGAPPGGGPRPSGAPPSGAVPVSGDTGGSGANG
jgi:hypothetical protein